MGEMESDYTNYENARDLEGGPHPGRSNPSRGVLVAAAVVLGLLALGGVVLALIPR